MWEKEVVMGVLTLDLKNEKLGLSVDNRIALDGSGVPNDPIRVILNVDRNFYKFLLESYAKWILREELYIDELFLKYNVHVNVDFCEIFPNPHILDVMSMVGTVIAHMIGGQFIRGYRWVDYVKKDNKNIVKISALEKDYENGNIILELLEDDEAEDILDYISLLYKVYKKEPLTEWDGIKRKLLS
jgi:hypothetical protein